MNILKVIWVPLFFIVSVFLVQFGHPLSSDEGALLGGSWKIYNGQTLYKDFFSYIPPGSYYFVKYSFDLFGPSYYSAKIFSVILLLLSTFATYKIALSLTRLELFSKIIAWVWLVFASVSYPIVNYNALSTFLAILSIYFFIRAIKSNFFINYLLAGISLGAVTIFLQHKGIVLTSLFILLAAFYTWIFKKVKLVNLTILLLSTALLPLLVISYWNPLTIYQYLIVWPITHPVPFNPVSYPFLAILVIYFCIISFWIYQKDKAVDRQVLVIIFISQMALLISMFPRRTSWYLVINSFGFLMLTGYLVYYLLTKIDLKNSIGKTLVIFNTTISIGAILIYLFSSNLESLTNYEYFKTKIRNHHIEKLYAYPFIPGIYFELGLHDPYPYGVLVTTQHPTSAFQENLSVLLKERPNHVLVNYEIAKKYQYNQDNPLDTYIHQNYKEVDRFGSLLIMEKLNLEKN